MPFYFLLWQKCRIIPIWMLCLLPNRSMTEEGYKKLMAELKELETVERPKISAAIAEARDKGDLSENAEYDAARRRAPEHATVALSESPRIFIMVC